VHKGVGVSLRVLEVPDSTGKGGALLWVLIKAFLRHEVRTVHATVHASFLFKRKDTILSVSGLGVGLQDPTLRTPHLSSSTALNASPISSSRM
jgi:hypothetical protein